MAKTMAAGDVRQTLDQALVTLTGQKRRAAAYLRENLSTAFSSSVQELARAAQVSEATLVRLARDLGFGGYLELRAALMHEARTRLAPEERFALEPPPLATSDTALRVARQEVDNINRTVAELDPKALLRFVKRLSRARPVATLGLGVSALVARLAAYQLFQVGVPAQVLLRDPVSINEQVDCLPDGAVLLAFAFPPYSRQTVEAARRAVARRVPVLAITDAPSSPLAVSAEAALYAKTGSVLYTNSLSAVMVVISALVTDLALADKKRALAHARALARAAAPEVLADGEGG
jgi:DNA-binding MurR/RpiR family transcriptional regulator